MEAVQSVRTRSLRSSGVALEASPEGKVATLMRMPLLYQQQDALPSAIRQKLLDIVNRARHDKLFTLAEDTAQGQDGEGEFRQLVYEPHSPVLATQQLPELLLPLVMAVPDINIAITNPAKQLTRAFVSSTTAADPVVDPEGTVLCWHGDGPSHGPVTLATIFTWFDGPVPPNYEGNQIHISIRDNRKLPVDLLLAPTQSKQNNKRKKTSTQKHNNKSKKTKMYQYTDPRQYISITTPPNALTVLLGGELPHAVEQVKHKDVIRYAAILFFTCPAELRGIAARQWQGMLRL